MKKFLMENDLPNGTKVIVDIGNGNKIKAKIIGVSTIPLPPNIQNFIVKPDYGFPNEIYKYECFNIPNYCIELDT